MDASSVRIDTQGIDRLHARVSRLPDLVAKAAMDIASIAAESITSGNKSGLVYTRGGRAHVASAPGEAPASDTGFLAASIHPRRADVRGYTWEVSADAEYAQELEMVKNRPFMLPALVAVRPVFLRAVRAVLLGKAPPGQGRGHRRGAGTGET